MYCEHAVAVLIPAYNEEKTVTAVLGSVPNFVDQIIVVDDGSTDGTGAALEAFVRQRHENSCRAVPYVHILRHAVNQGVGAAFSTGLAYVLEKNFDIMVHIDADGQFSPEDIPALLQPIVEGQADFVTASRFVDPAQIPHMPRLKRWGNRQMTALINFLTRQHFHDVSCGFRAYSYHAMSKLNLFGKYTYTHETFLNLAFSGMRIREVPVTVQYFPDRKSRVASSVSKYVIQVLLIILRTYRDYRPLTFFWGISSLLLPLALGFGGFFFSHYLCYGMFSPHIWAACVSAFLFFNCLAFFLIGIVADMFARVRESQEKIFEMLYRERRSKPHNFGRRT